MAEILEQMENFLNITSINKALHQSLHTHVGNIAGENRPILQAPIKVPNLTSAQYDEVMAVVPEDIWNLAC